MSVYVKFNEQGNNIITHRDVLQRYDIYILTEMFII